MFSGINLASGGAPVEYGNALSAVLPLETKEQSTVNKIGVNASITRTWTSFNNEADFLQKPVAAFAVEATKDEVVIPCSGLPKGTYQKCSFALDESLTMEIKLTH